MALDLENDEAFSAAIKGLPKVTELIASVPKEKRFLAWCAARQSYLQTAQTLGFEENDAQEWASAVMTFVKSPTQPNGVSAQEAEAASERLNKQSDEYERATPLTYAPHDWSRRAFRSK